MVARHSRVRVEVLRKLAKTLVLEFCENSQKLWCRLSLFKRVIKVLAEFNKGVKKD